MYSEKSIKQYLNDLAARVPAPGGGSSAALAGAMASALISMALNFTIGNEKYKAFEERAKEMLAVSEGLRQGFVKFFEEDIRSYDAVAKAYKLPKDTDEDKRKRNNAVQEALKQALLVPFEVCAFSVEALKLCPVLAREANKNLICDVEAPWRLLEAAFYSAKINVVMNQKGVEDKNFNRDISIKLKRLEKELLKYKKISAGAVLKVARRA